jgi:hypothetical protein
MIATARNFPMPAWAWVALYSVFAVEMYIIKAPRSWKPWSRRADRAKARRSVSYTSRTVSRRSFVSPADAATDRLVAAYEGQITGNHTEPEVMAEEHKHLVAAGLLDPDQPTPWSHHQWRTQASRDFTPEERMVLRYNFLPEANGAASA